jgi:hypothetical protein
LSICEVALIVVDEDDGEGGSEFRALVIVNSSNLFPVRS